MEDNKSLVLSGRTFVARIAFASTDVIRTAISDGALSEDGRQPMVGDVRLSATLAPETRGKNKAVTQCAGSLQASIFDGSCWQRFEISTLTGMYRFGTEIQLRGVLGWANRAVHTAAGRTCRLVTGPTGFPVYELLPQPSSQTASPSSADAQRPANIDP